MTDSKFVNLPDRYTLLRLLGKGAMGEVFLAEDSLLERRVAIKTLRTAEEESPGPTSLLTEARSAARLDHPFICKVYDVEPASPGAYVVMEYVEGTTLESLIEDGPLDSGKAVQYALEMAEAIDEAHQRGVLHRDLKPANIMITKSAHVKVLDFGLATGVRDSAAEPAETIEFKQALRGTPLYLSPELIRGLEATPQSDAFSLGLILYQMLTGVHPFKQKTVVQTMLAIVNNEHAPIQDHNADIQNSLVSIINRLLAKDPQHRFENVGALCAALREVRQYSRPGSGRGEEISGSGLVGRDAEIKKLHRALRGAEAGRGHLFLIEGEAGVGKTHLCRSFEAQLPEGQSLWLTGRCHEHEAGDPLHPLVALFEELGRQLPNKDLESVLGQEISEIARILPELRTIFPRIHVAVDIPDQEQRRFLFAAILRVLARLATRCPLVILLEDIQWADEATLELLIPLSQSLEEMRALVLCTYQPGLGSPDFQSAVDLLTGVRSVIPISLNRLDDDSVSEMIGNLAGSKPPSDFVALIQRLTSGNPLFVEEVFESLCQDNLVLDEKGNWHRDHEFSEADLPGELLTAIGNRLARMGRQTREVLAMAAVIGRSFRLSVLESLHENPELLYAALEASEMAEIIAPAPPETDADYVFEHELYRQALINDLSLVRKRSLHAKIALSLEKIWAHNLHRHAPTLVYHLRNAGTLADLGKTATYLRLAAERALETGGWREALDYLRSAKQLVASEDGLETARLLHQTGRALRGLGRWDEAAGCFTEAFSLFERLERPSEVAAAARALWHILSWDGLWAEARQFVERALESIRKANGEETNGSDICRLEALRGVSLAFVDQFEEGVVLLDEAFSKVRKLRDRQLEGWIKYQRSVCDFFHMETTSLIHNGQEAVQLLQQSGRLWDLGPAMTMYQTSVLAAGKLEDVSRIQQEVESVAAQLSGDFGTLLTSIRNTGLSSFIGTGDLDEFEGFARQDYRICQEARFPWIYDSYTYLGLIEFWRGNWASSLEHFRKAASVEVFGVNRGSGEAILFLAKAYLGEADALDILEDCRCYFPVSGQRNGFGSWRLLARSVEGLALLGEYQQAGSLYPQTLEALATGTRILLWRETLLEKIAGIAASCRADWVASEHHFQRALEEARSLPYLYEEAETLVWYSRMLLERSLGSDGFQAANQLRNARKIYGRLGMPRHLQMATDLLESCPG